MHGNRDQARDRGLALAPVRGRAQARPSAGAPLAAMHPRVLSRSDS